MPFSVIFFLNIVFKSTVLLTATWLLLFLLRRRSAAQRHQMWSLAFTAVLALPFFATVLPEWRVPLGNWLLTNTFLFRTEVHPAPVSDSQAPRSSVLRRADGQRWDGSFLWVVWGLGAAASLGQMSIGWAAVARMRRNTTVLRLAEFELLAREMGVSKQVELRQGPAATMPITYGLIQPVILLPADVTTWTSERRRAVLLHELAHVRRNDGAAQLLARLTLALYWWHPLLWAAWREFLKERERAADDVVLSLGSKATDYASHLVEIARSMRSADALGWAAIAMARPSQLEDRISAVLDSKRDRKAPRRGIAIVALVGVTAIAAPWAAVQAEEQTGQSASQTSTASGADSRAISILSQGKTALANRNYANAFNLFASAQASDGRLTAESKMWQAITQERQENFESAGDFYLVALAAASPDSSMAATIMELYGQVLLKLHKDEEAKAMAVHAADIRETLSKQLTSTVHHGPEVHKIGGDVKPPALLSKIEPEYSADARLAKYSGAVLLTLEIGRDGKPRNINVIRGLGLGLDEEATKAVSQWKFKPGTVSGTPVAVIANVEVNFKLL
jgi:TonB family protein